MAKTTEFKKYTAESIKILEGLEAVRKRPGMYIGSTGVKGLHHMLWEIVDNSVDEAMGGFASKIDVTISKTGSVIVEDDGRGFPIDIHPKTKKPAVETVLTVLHAGGKFDNSSYKVSGGLHGVGASVVNALSSYFKVNVVRDSKEHCIEFVDGGKLKKSLYLIGECEKKSGSKVEFVPDWRIMEKSELDNDIISSRLQQLAYLNRGILFSFLDERIENAERLSWKYDGGISEYVKYINENKEPIMSRIIFDEIETSVTPATLSEQENNEKYQIKVEVAFQYNKSYRATIFSFCNNIATSEGGTHEDGFKSALLKFINKYIFEKKILKENDEKVNKDDISEGLTAVISIKHPNPQYEGQTKQKLGNTEVKGVTAKVVYSIFEKFMLENPEDALLICEKVISARNVRIEQQKAGELARRKSPFDSTGSLPGKLADCSTRDSSISELYLVEGDSAGGSAKLGRDRFFQAILPLRGKILNVEKVKMDKIFENDAITSMITAIGSNVGSEFNILKLRYDKIIIMTDADVDGAHIRILLLTFFFRYMKSLIESDHIYIAQPPLFKVSIGKQVSYCYSEQELLNKKNEHVENIQIQRYKGLGEMNPEQLWDTTMNPRTRMLHKVTIDDAAFADQSFSLLMGEDVAPRKEFIQKNAHYVKNLDI